MDESKQAKPGPTGLRTFCFVLYLLHIPIYPWFFATEAQHLDSLASTLSP